METPAHLHGVNGHEAALVAGLLSLGLGLRADGSVPVLGVTGLQGSGKSTLAAQLVAAANAQGDSVVALSIDDFYLTRAERRALAATVHPLLGTRGPPGTHDVELACRTIDALRGAGNGEPVAMPAFDKIDDDRLPRPDWPVHIGAPALIVLEGWFLKVPPAAPPTLQPALNDTERERDPDGRWRAYCNEALAGYAPLWDRIDHLVFLQPPGFEVVPGWRWQQERTLQAGNPDRQAMTRGQVLAFIELFERVSRQALDTLPTIADRVIPVDAQRRPLGTGAA